MKILLVIPPSGNLAKKYLAPSMGVGILAGLSTDHAVKIVDGNVEKIDYSDEWDLVGISASTPAANYAFAIADGFRDLGVTVVMGGVHPTVLPEECLLHADSICVGEGEIIWPQLLVDFKAGKLQPVYRAKNQMNPIVIPEIPRHLYSKKKYLINNTVLMSRGCPNLCEFCLVKRIYGPGYRMRQMEDILHEIASLKNDHKPLVFVDDNIVGNKEFAKEFFRRLKPLNKKWMSQCSLSIANDEELLKLAKESGCSGLFIGFESLNDQNLTNNRKYVNKAGEFRRKIERLHQEKIIIHGSFIFGFDLDTIETFRQTTDFAIDVKLEAANFGILVPYPGTPLYDKYVSEGRIFDFNWSHYDAAHVVFKHPHLSTKELAYEQYNAMKKFYSFSSMLKRIGRNPDPFVWVLNFSQVNVVKELAKNVKQT